MTDHQDRPDQDQSPPPAGTDSEDLGGAEVQQAQDEAGIAGEPQPADTDAEADEAD